MAKLVVHRIKKLFGCFHSCRATFCALTVFVFVVTVVCIGFINKSLLFVYFSHYKTGYLCPVFRGGLGNLMFQYASLYGISKTKRMTLVLENKDFINNAFPQLDVMKMKNSSIYCSEAILIGEVKPCAYHLETFNYNRMKHIKQKAYLQSWKYFYNNEQDLRKQFVFKPEVQIKAQKVIDSSIQEFIKRKHTSKNLQVIGVHIRRGDYLKAHNIKYGYNVVTKKYIDKALKFFRSAFDNCLFIAFTGPDPGDIKWRNQNVNGSDVIHVSPNAREVDMCALSKCNHTLITVGSFGWWSAWLANGITVYYKDVARQNSSLKNDFSEDMSDFFPRHWIGM